MDTTCRLGQLTIPISNLVLMSTRFLHIRVLLYRPLLVQLCWKINAQEKEKTPSQAKRKYYHSRDANKLHAAFSEKCSVECIETAQTLIDHIGTTSDTTCSGSPWYRFYCIVYVPVIFVRPLVLTLARSLSCSHGGDIGRSLFAAFATCQPWQSLQILADL